MEKDHDAKVVLEIRKRRKNVSYHGFCRSYRVLAEQEIKSIPRGKRGVTKGERVGGDRNETLRWAWKKSHEVGR